MISYRNSGTRSRSEQSNRIGDNVKREEFLEYKEWSSAIEVVLGILGDEQPLKVTMECKDMINKAVTQMQKSEETRELSALNTGRYHSNTTHITSPLTSTTDGPVPSRVMVLSISSADQDALVLSPNLPSADTVSSWGTGELHRWLTATEPPPLGYRIAATGGFLYAHIDCPVFLAATER